MSIAQLRSGNLAAARRIARSLGSTEDALDGTILAQAKLLTAIVEGRVNSGAAIQVGHSAFQKAAAALEALARARDCVVDCHDDLADVRDHFRLRADDVGCTSDKGVPARGLSEAA